MKLASHPTPHLWGRLDYTSLNRLMPDGDTIHLRDPVLVMNGRVTKPVNDVLEIAMPGRARPHVLELRGDPLLADTALGDRCTRVPLRRQRQA